MEEKTLLRFQVLILRLSILDLEDLISESTLHASQVVLAIKNRLPMQETQETRGSILGSGRSPERGHSNPLHSFCLETPHGQRSLVGYTL